MRSRTGYFIWVLGALMPLTVCTPAHAGGVSKLAGHCGHALGRLVSAWDSAKATLGGSNRFRGAGEYSVDFGQPFIADLRSLGPDAAVLEFGSGEGYFAKQVFLGEEVQTGELFDITGYYTMGKDMIIPIFRYYRLPVEAHKALVDYSVAPLDSKPKYFGFSRDGVSGVFSDRVHFIVGDVESQKTTQSPPLRDLQGAGLMVDQFGVFSYARNPSRYLNWALNKLRVGGVLYLHFSSNHNRLWRGYHRWEALDAFFHRIEGVDTALRTFPLVERGENQPAPSTGHEPSKNGVLNAGGVWRLERVSAAPVRVPVLTSQFGVPLSQGVSFRTFSMSKDQFEALD